MSLFIRRVNVCPSFLFQISRFMSVNKLKYFFAVDTKYVMKKLMILMFPYTHQVISAIHSSDFVLHQCTGRHKTFNHMHNCLIISPGIIISPTYQLKPRKQFNQPLNHHSSFISEHKNALFASADIKAQFIPTHYLTEIVN